MNHIDHTRGRCEHQQLALAFGRLADDGNPHFPEEQLAVPEELSHPTREEE